MDISGDIKPVAKANYVSSARAIVKEVHVQSSARLEITAQLVAARPGARVARYIESHKGTQLARAFNLIKQHLHSLTCIHVKAKLGRDYSLAWLVMHAARLLEPSVMSSLHFVYLAMKHARGLVCIITSFDSFRSSSTCICGLARYLRSFVHFVFL